MEADQQKKLVEAEIGVKIAEQNKEKAIKFAEGDAESIRLKAEGQPASARIVLFTYAGRWKHPSPLYTYLSLIKLFNKSDINAFQSLVIVH
jgi:hypothetical protein